MELQRVMVVCGVLGYKERYSSRAEVGNGNDITRQLFATTRLSLQLIKDTVCRKHKRVLYMRSVADTGTILSTSTKRHKTQ